MSYNKNTPHIEFQVNKEMDYWAAKEFLTFDNKDAFSNGILELYPELENTKQRSGDEKFAMIKDIVDREYERTISILNDKEAEIQIKWNKVENTFLETTKKLFKGHHWPAGQYVVFLSIFNCNPRFLDQKTFQVYYKHEEGSVYVCAHELLHFMFYDYVAEHKELIADLNEEQLWKLSEIFNVALLETKEFADITGNPHPKAYKSHEDLIPKFREILKASKDVDDFITQGASKLR